MLKWYKLPNSLEINKKVTSTLGNVDDTKITYNTLEMTYKLEMKLFWFWIYSRRRKAEKVSLIEGIVFIKISKEELFEIPLFKQYYNENRKSDDNIRKNIVNYINSDLDILKDLMFKYIPKMRKELYGKYETVELVCKEHDRFSSDDGEELLENFIKYCDNHNRSFSEKDNLNITVDDIIDCIANPL